MHTVNLTGADRPNRSVAGVCVRTLASAVQQTGPATFSATLPAADAGPVPWTAGTPASMLTRTGEALTIHEMLS